MSDIVPDKTGIIAEQRRSGAIDAARQAKDTIAWIMNGGAESSDENQRMIDRLNRLELSIETALKLYGEQNNQDYWSIQAIGMNLEYGFGTEELSPENIDIKGIFAGLYSKELNEAEIERYRLYLANFLEKSPEIQAEMLWFFDLVDTYVINAEANQKSLQENPIKAALFKDNDAVYSTWINAINMQFMHDEESMVVLGEIIRRSSGIEIDTRYGSKDVGLVLARVFRDLVYEI